MRERNAGLSETTMSQTGSSASRQVVEGAPPRRPVDRMRGGGPEPRPRRTSSQRNQLRLPRAARAGGGGRLGLGSPTGFRAWSQPVSNRRPPACNVIAAVAHACGLRRCRTNRPRKRAFASPSGLPSADDPISTADHAMTAPNLVEDVVSSDSDERLAPSVPDILDRRLRSISLPAGARRERSPARLEPSARPSARGRA